MFEKIINSAEEMKMFGKSIAESIKDGGVIELIGDVGAGKTTFTKGLAEGLGVAEDIQSPSFTISRTYDFGEKTLSHYDFYRLKDAGIMEIELASNIFEGGVIVVEWAESVAEVLPDNRIRIEILPLSENSRKVKVWGSK